MSDALGQVEAEATADSGNPLAGTVSYAGSQYAAYVGAFTVQQRLREDGGGFVPSSMADVVIQKSVLPVGFTFRSGQQIDVTAPLSATRACQILAAKDGFSFWSITVDDLSAFA